MSSWLVRIERQHFIAQQTPIELAPYFFHAKARTVGFRIEEPAAPMPPANLEAG
jgi:hypothetical protein